MIDEKLFFVKRRKGTYSGTHSLFVLLLAAAFAFVSCDDFFSTSWGTPRAYDPSKIDVNAGNIDRWIKESAGNPELAKALTDKIKAELAGAQGNLTPDQLKLQNAGVKLAIEAAGLGEALLGNAASAINKLNSDSEVDENAIKEILENIQNDFKKSGPTAAGNLADIAGYSLKEAGKPQFSDDYAKSVKPGDVGMAVLTLSMAVVGDKLNEDEFDLQDLEKSGIKVTDGKVSITENSGSDPKVVVLAAYLNLIADDNNSDKFTSNPITSAIKDAFGVGK